MCSTASPYLGEVEGKEGEEEGKEEQVGNMVKRIGPPEWNKKNTKKTQKRSEVDATQQQHSNSNNSTTTQQQNPTQHSNSHCHVVTIHNKTVIHRIAVVRHHADVRVIRSPQPHVVPNDVAVHDMEHGLHADWRRRVPVRTAHAKEDVVKKTRGRRSPSVTLPGPPLNQRAARRDLRRRRGRRGRRGRGRRGETCLHENATNSHTINIIHLNDCLYLFRCN